MSRSLPLCNPPASYMAQAKRIAESMEELQTLFDELIEELVGGQWPSFERKIAEKLMLWASMQDTLFYRPELANQDINNTEFVLRSNHHLLDTVTELVYHTRWPKSHDKVM